MRRARWLGLIVLGCLALLYSPMKAAASDPPPVQALILYDANWEYAWLGELHALQIANLLGHFPIAYTIKPVDEYTAGEVENYVATFYLGEAYRDRSTDPLPSAFLLDVMTTQRTVCWFRYNLWQVAWDESGASWNPDFTDRYAFQVIGYDEGNYPEVLYKDETFVRDLTDSSMGGTWVLDAGKADEVATAHRPASETQSEAWLPYAIHSENLWYFADIPFSYASEEDRYLVFCDLIHDIVGVDHPVSRRATIRLEDVSPSPYDNPSDLTGAATYLHSQSVPFQVAAIPVFNDPLGELGAPQQVRLRDSSSWKNALSDAVSRGGQIIAHGYTHQYDSTQNPYNGVTADDSEFFISTWDSVQNDTLIVSPVPEDSVAWVNGRIDSALAELTASGFTPIAWETPHYLASALDSTEFGNRFDLCAGRMLYFTADGSHFTGQFFPYVIERDVYGQRIMPENLGNVEPEPFYDYPTRFPADIIRAAQKNLVIRDAWASAYFHPDLDIDYLKQIIQGVKMLGYSYKAASTVIAEAGPDKTIIEENSTTIEGSASNGSTPYTYSWSPTTGLSDPAVAHPTASPTTTTLYTLTATDHSGGTDMDTMTVIVIPKLVADAGPAKTITLGDPVILESAVSGGEPPYTYSWSPTTGLDHSDVAQPTASPSATTTYTLTVTDSGTQTATDTVEVTVVPHTLTVISSAAPSTAPSEGSADLSAVASDSGPHEMVSWSWSDGGAGGSFSPSASVQNPTYTAPANVTDSDQSVTLTVTVTCNGPSPLDAEGSTTLTVQPVAHALLVSASANPSTVASGGVIALSASAADSRTAHGIASWSWSDGGAGGSFSPSNHVQNPSYTAPLNRADSNQSVTLTVTATCNGPTPIIASGSTSAAVQPVAHSLTIIASAAPTSVASGGSTSLSAAFTDSRSAHTIASWSWSDGGAGGSFSPSANVRSPSYTAPANHADTDQTVTLTVTGTCDGPEPLTKSGSTTLTVHPIAHSFSIEASAPSPATVPSSGSTTLSATATDSRSGHTFSWSWSDGGADGNFLPSAAVQSPSYTAPVNHLDADQSIALTVHATCNGPQPLSDSDTTTLTVQPVAHSVAVDASVVPNTVASGGSAALSATATDSRSAHTVISWSWSDNGAGGSFAPSANVQNPTYTALPNESNDDRAVTLTATATCGGPDATSGSGSTTLVVQPAPHVVSVTVSANPPSIASSGTTGLTASATDDRHHAIAAWAWSDNGAGGTFSPSASAQNPEYRAPQNLTAKDAAISLTATATCEGPYPVSESGSVTLAVQSIPPGSSDGESKPAPLSLVWGESADLSVVYRNLDSFAWRTDEQYHLQAEDRMDRWGAVSLPLGSEVLPGAEYTFDFSVTAPPLTTVKYDLPVTATSPGVTDTLSSAWEFARGEVVWDGSLVSDDVVISRFHDIQPDQGHEASWARFQIEELAGRVPAVVKGYGEGTYRPTEEVARDAMAVYVLRALKLPTAPYEGRFNDVTEADSWAWAEIEGLARAGVVQGFDDGSYRPAEVVKRDVMAVYVARALVGGMDVPAGPPDPSFTDVLTDNWAYSEIEYCVNHGVVQGFEDKTYRPGEAVDRGQMAVYMWRAFVMPVDSAVVLGGPAVTAVDPELANYDGWSSLSSASASSPGYAYIVFDAARLGPDLAAGDGAFDVRFELRGAATTTGSVVSLTAADLIAARNAARSSGVAYSAVYWAIPAGLPAGAYTLVASVEHEPGVFQELALQPTVTIAP